MRLIPLVALLALSPVLGAVDKVQLLKVRPGLWQVTTTVTANQLPIPAGLLEKLTPEQRARVEERINTQTTHETEVTARRYCLTREELRKGPTFGEERKSCQRTTLTSSASQVDMRLECFDHNIKTDETLHIEALSSESVKGSLRFSVAGDDGVDSSATFTAKWMGPQCSAH